MSLIKCSECGKEISNKASTCPHCGNPIQVHFDVSPYDIISNHETKKCSHCGRDIPKRIGKCPYCGKNQNPILSIIGIGLLIWIFLSIINIL